LFLSSARVALCTAVLFSADSSTRLANCVSSSALLAGQFFLTSFTICCFCCSNFSPESGAAVATLENIRLAASESAKLILFITDILIFIKAFL
jgi:hypothetical protein